MSSSNAVSPVPPSDSTEGGNISEWRASVPQSERSKEVREIARVLASLEPGATSASKLMLAMRFEDNIFNAATSLADYRKKLAKRLKKVKKNYAPPVAQPVSANDNEQRIIDLRSKYGEKLLFIVKHSSRAVAAMKEKSGEEHAKLLKGHTADAVKWATRLGLISGDSTKIPNLQKTDLDKLEHYCGHRVENIRTHVVKLTQPDKFLEEKLTEIEEDYFSKPQTCRILSKAMMHQFKKLGWVDFGNAEATLKQSWENASQTIPPPSRDPRSKTKTALAYLDAMRAASQALLAHLATENKSTVGIPKNVMEKCHSIATEGISYLTNEMPEASASSKQSKLTLESAWTKIMESPTAHVDVEDLHGQDEASLPPPAKRLKPTIVKSRVLLTRGRACPTSLLPALKRKGAKLEKLNGGAACLVLSFDEVFLMTVHLVPLLVNLEAKSHDGTVAVWGAEGGWDALGHVVENRLDHASAHATQVLRECFASGTAKARNDIELEICEANSLLKFLQLARITYIPDWKDIEVPTV